MPDPARVPEPRTEEWSDDDQQPPAADPPAPGSPAPPPTVDPPAEDAREAELGLEAQARAHRLRASV